MLPIRTQPHHFMNNDEQQDYFHTLYLAVNKTIFNKQFHKVSYKNHSSVFIEKINDCYQAEIISQIGRMKHIKTYIINKNIINNLIKPNLSIHFQDIEFLF